MENRLPIVTTIVPVYNVVPYIMKCVKSIQNQRFPNLEIIIIDDGSTDGSSELCDKFAVEDPRIKVIHQKNSGVVMARGRGIDEASGSFISFVDGDDWIEPDMIEKMVNQIGNRDLITTGVSRELTPGRWIKETDMFSEGLYFGEAGVSQILSRMIYDFDLQHPQPFTPGMCNKLYRANIIKKVYKEIDPDITYEEDAVLTYKYLLQCRSVVVSHQSFYHYRYRDGSAIHSVNSHVLENINKVYLSLEEDFRKHKLSNCLLLQLQRWITFMTCRAINDFMGFDKCVCIPEYLANLTGLEDKKLILYGAGRAGKDTYAQLRHYGYQVVLWVDKNYKVYREKGLQIASLDEISNAEYDQIFIAVGDVDLAEEIKKDLLKRGISKDVLIWRKPMHIF